MVEKWLLVAIPRDFVWKDRPAYYKKMVEELKKIPDVIVMDIGSPEILSYVDIYEGYGFFGSPLIVDIFDLEHERPLRSRQWYEYPQIARITYDGSKIAVMEKDPTKPGLLSTVRSVVVQNKKDIVPLINSYVRDVLAKITEDNKYIIETRKVEEDISKISTLYLHVYELDVEDLEEAAETMDSDFIDYLRIKDTIEATKDCVPISGYTLRMTYMYPYTAREVDGVVFCCLKECYFVIMTESERGEFDSDKMFVIELHGRQASRGTIEQVFRTNKQMLAEIEKYIIERLKEQE